MLIPILILSGCGKNKTEKQSDGPKKITLVDNVGRKVELPYPVKKAVVANRYNSELIRACGAIDSVISVDMGTAQDRENCVF